MKTIQINQEVLQSLYSDCTESMSEVFSEFLTNHAEIKQNLVSSFESGFFDSLKKFLHFHGPCFMYVGMPEVSDCFRSLEQQCGNATDQYTISSNFSDLLQMIDKSRLLVVNELGRLNKVG